MRIRDKLLRFPLFGIIYANLWWGKTHAIHYVIGHYSSGTTILDRLITMHPECARLHTEGVQLVYFLDTPEDYSERRYWIKAYPKLKLRLTAKQHNTAQNIWRRASETNRETKCIIEKSIVNILRIRQFIEFDDRSRVIHIVRDTSDIIQSYYRRNLIQNNEDLKLLQRQIKLSNELGERLEDSKKYTLTYEKLCKNPVKELSTIYNFLGLSEVPITYESGILTVMQTSQKLEY